MQNNTLLRRLAYIEQLVDEGSHWMDRGYQLVACDGKRPIGKQWQREQVDVDILAEKLESADEPAIGLKLGPESGLIDIETDSPEEEQAFAELLDGCESVVTPTFESTRGKHRLFAWDTRLEAIGKAVIYFKGVGSQVGIRLGAGEKGAQSVIPPSKGRTWFVSFDEAEPAKLPEKAVARLLASNKPPEQSNSVDQPIVPEAQVSDVVAEMIRSTRGMQDHTDGSKRLLAVACRAVEHNLTNEQAVNAIRSYSAVRPFPRQYSDHEITQRLHDAASRGDVERGRALQKTFSLTDMGNGERFVHRFGDTVRYLHKWKRWFVWDGSRWSPDETSEVMRHAKRTAKGIFEEVPLAENEEESKKVANWARSTHSRGRLESMLALAQSEKPIPIAHDSLDADPWLLNCANGTVDLRSGHLRPHAPGDLLTKTTHVEFPDEAGADAVMWLEFLETIFGGDHQLMEFVQRLMGVALVGEQTEHLLPVFHGAGANGKSVFTSIVQKALGDYAMTAPQGLLMSRRSESHPTELADLFGRRLVILSETKDNQQLDEGQVKAITGGDRIRARRMREDFWEFKPSHLSIVVTNHRPVVRGTDNGIWRRIRLVPFNVTIAPEKQDKHLPQKLAQELPAILKWMIEGCLAWQRNGLGDPAAVHIATNEYRSDSDVLQRWIDSECLLDEKASGKSSLLFEQYVAWCQRTGEEPMKQRQFGQRMQIRFDSKRLANGVFYQGIGLVTENK